MEKYYLIIINDLPQQTEIVPARSIVEELLGTKRWLFSPYTAKVNSLEPGDRAVVYAVGKGNRVFLASFAIKTMVSQAP